ncbi:hypothetical protein [Actinopolymorpha cephalotaxi]|uniref:hypothetical protein n=1 Tax=Actinopolymorpha cephalotaxi TaxID=504797 RepID=UPI0015870766|nr:hypothetical protein [Actinopolymorpha cephalotaxi]
MGTSLVGSVVAAPPVALGRDESEGNPACPGKEACAHAGGGTVPNTRSGSADGRADHTSDNDGNEGEPPRTPALPDLAKPLA